MALSCSLVQNHLIQLSIQRLCWGFMAKSTPIVNTLWQKAQCEIWWKLLEQFQKKTFKNYTILYMYTAQGRGQITPQGTNFWFWLKSFTTLITHSYTVIQPLVINTFWENNFSIFSPYKYMWAQTWPCHKKGQRPGTYYHHLNKLDRPWVPNA